MLLPKRGAAFWEGHKKSTTLFQKICWEEPEKQKLRSCRAQELSRSSAQWRGGGTEQCNETSSKLHHEDPTNTREKESRQVVLRLRRRHGADWNVSSSSTPVRGCWAIAAETPKKILGKGKTNLCRVAVGAVKKGFSPLNAVLVLLSNYWSAVPQLASLFCSRYLMSFRTFNGGVSPARFGVAVTHVLIALVAPVSLVQWNLMPAGDALNFICHFYTSCH
jgi:hypothetical protein